MLQINTSLSDLFAIHPRSDVDMFSEVLPRPLENHRRYVGLLALCQMLACFA